MSESANKTFYNRQIEFLASKDVDALIANQYVDDASLLSFTNHIQGADNLREYFKQYVEQLGYIKLLSTDQFAETDDSIFFEATVETAGGIARVYDAFYLRDGKIFRHYTGLLSFTPHGQQN